MPDPTLPTLLKAAPPHGLRLTRLQAGLTAAGLDGVLLFQSRDVFYYTGTAQPGYLLVTPARVRLMVRGGFDLALAETALDPGLVEPLRPLDQIAGRVREALGPKGVLGTELDFLPVTRYRDLARHFQGFELVDCSRLVLGQRMVKDETETAALRRAGRICLAGHERALEVLRPGLSELELAAAVETAHRLAGHEGAFFIRQPDFFMSRGPVASGPNLARFSGVVYSVAGVGLSPALPLGPSRRVMEPGDLVMVDVPVMVDGYHSDLTRTYHLGPAGAETRDLFAALQDIFETTLARLRPGLTGREVYETALARAQELGQGRTFLSFGPAGQGQLVGHGVGLEINEPPSLAAWDRTVLPEGAVVAVEMHLTDPAGRVVKLEETIALGPAGIEVLTPAPRRLFEV